MKIILKNIKYENNIYFIKNIKYTKFYVYFAQKTKKDMLYSARSLLNSNNITLIQYNKQWQPISPIKNQIPWNLYSVSSSLFIGFCYTEKITTNASILKIHALDTKPLLLINSHLPKQIFNVYRYNLLFMGNKPSDFFSQLLINQYVLKIQRFNTSIFSWLDLIYKLKC